MLIFTHLPFLENHLITNKLKKAGTRQKRGQYILKYEVAVEK